MNKKWYLSKTVWVAVVGVLAAVYDATGAQVPIWLYPILSSLGLIGLRDGMK